jgi:hypothetical protein
MTISPHGGYLSIDEGTDFYIECIGDDAKWIIARRLTSDNVRYEEEKILFLKINFSTIRVSTSTIEVHRKSILAIHGMDISLIGPYLCQTNESVSTIILQLISMI